VFFDTDTNSQTGYQVGGALFGSEMMIETGYGYDQRNGSFNAGSISSVGWEVAPSVSATEFEFQVSLAALYPGNTRVFGANPLRILLQDDRGPESAPATGIEYVMSPPQLSPLFISQTNSVVNLRWTGPGTLQGTGSLTAGTWTNVVNADGSYSFAAGAGQQYFRLAQ
jgi:hypothetical protein